MTRLVGERDPTHDPRILTQAPMEIKWHDIDPETGEKRYLCAERFARAWSFKWKLQKRGDWTRGLEPTLEMWEHVLDSLERRYRRREGVSDEDITEVKRLLQEARKQAEARWLEKRSVE